MSLPRRDVLKLMGMGVTGLYLSGCSLLSKGSKQRNVSGAFSDLSSIGPIDWGRDAWKKEGWSGDNPERTHQILWDKQGYIQSLGKLPSPSEDVPLVIVGGGMSGLLSAYLLREYNPIILERAERFGGNAKGETWEGLEYSIGAAYFMAPEKGGKIEALLQELAPDLEYKVKGEEDPMELKGNIHRDFWHGGTDPKQKEQFVKLHQYLKEVCFEENGRTYPHLPVYDSDVRKKVEELDRVSLKAHVEEILGGPLHPHIETALEHFCWSSFGGSAQEISASAGLNFYTGEFSALGVAPGGNSKVAEALVKRLGGELSAGNLRPSSIVFDVKTDNEAVVVSYVDSKGEARAIRAKALIMSCPKFVAKILMDDMETERREAIESLRYRSYLVCNVLLDQHIDPTFYDLYLLGRGAVDYSDLEKDSALQGATDVVLGTYAKGDGKRSVLTLYRAFPFDGLRATLLDPEAFGRFKKEFENQVVNSILPMLKISPQKVKGLRLARWGHPLPLAEVGHLSHGTIDKIIKPFKERVFFIEQDNWMLPAFETCANEALQWTPQVRKLLS